MSATETTKVTALFPHGELTPIEPGGTLTPRIVRTWKRELFANAIAVHSHRGGGTHGHLGILLNNAAYHAYAGAGVNFDAPDYPGQAPVYGAHATAAQLAATKDTWERNMKDFETKVAVNKALCKLIINACPDEYIAELKNTTIGYANVTAKAFLEHLQTNYGALTPDDIVNNRTLMDKAWSPNTPIQTLWIQIKECQDVATEAGNPISATDAVNSALANIENTGQFSDAVREWRSKAIADWTLANLKIHFNKAERERNRQLTAKKAGYHGANKVVEPLAEKENVADPAPKEQANQAKGPETAELFYCWSHGLGHNPNHTSANCRKKKEGHKEKATISNMMGGSARIVRRRGDKPAEIFKSETDF